ATSTLSLHDALPISYGQNPVRGDAVTTAADQGEGVGDWPADFRKGEMKPKFFRSPLHCVKMSNDGFLYVCDRGNNRIQVFKLSRSEEHTSELQSRFE